MAEENTDKIASLMYEMISLFHNKEKVGPVFMFEQMKDKFVEAHRLDHEAMKTTGDFIEECTNFKERPEGLQFEFEKKPVSKFKTYHRKECQICMRFYNTDKYEHCPNCKNTQKCQFCGKIFESSQPGMKDLWQHETVGYSCCKECGDLKTTRSAAKILYLNGVKGKLR